MATLRSCAAAPGTLTQPLTPSSPGRLCRLLPSHRPETAEAVTKMTHLTQGRLSQTCLKASPCSPLLQPGHRFHCSPAGLPRAGNGRPRREMAATKVPEAQRLWQAQGARPCSPCGHARQVWPQRCPVWGCSRKPLAAPSARAGPDWAVSHRTSLLCRAKRQPARWPPPRPQLWACEEQDGQAGRAAPKQHPPTTATESNPLATHREKLEWMHQLSKGWRTATPPRDLQTRDTLQGCLYRNTGAEHRAGAKLATSVC